MNSCPVRIPKTEPSNEGQELWGVREVSVQMWGAAKG